METKKHTGIKKLLVNECQRIQQEAVDSSKTAMNEAQVALNEYGPNKDRYDSFRDQLIGRRDMFAGQYQKALAEYNVLTRINPGVKNDCAEFGAVIITEKSNFFISISIGKVTIDGNLFYAISPNVPLYKVMKGLKKGDVFEFNKQKHKILDIY
jgi:hypothetical protein